MDLLDRLLLLASVFPRPFTLEHARFAEKINPQPNGCWLWTGALVSRRGGPGHGVMMHHGKSLTARRAAWSLAGRAIHRDQELHPVCGVTHCVNPSHLEVLPKGSGGDPQAGRPQ